MFLRLISFVMILSVVFARNIQHDDDHASSSEVPCLMENPLHYHRHEAMSHEIDKSSSMPIFAIKNDDHHTKKMLLKKRTTIDQDLHTVPKPGCCG
ncbi:hypothetical protein M0802_012000 [Mischocyttarus mexicanus]|nr:hypothetical protein M0802_012000 [Mischocyttarus mexicanus]